MVPTAGRAELRPVGNRLLKHSGNKVNKGRRNVEGTSAVRRKYLPSLLLKMKTDHKLKGTTQHYGMAGHPFSRVKTLEKENMPRTTDNFSGTCLGPVGDWALTVSTKHKNKHDKANLDKQDKQDKKGDSASENKEVLH